VGGGLFGSEEEIVGGVGGTKFLIGVVGIAARGGGFAALGIKALDGCGAREDAGAFMTDDTDEEPGNGIGIGRGSIGDGFAVDAARVTCEPGGAGEMFAEEVAVGVEEIGIGSFQNPGVLRVFASFAGVDLVALGVNGKEELFASGRLELRGNLLGDGREGDEGSDEKAGAESTEHGTKPPGLRVGVGAEKNITLNTDFAIEPKVRGSVRRQRRRPKPIGS
jgi:hypothetical protein